MESFRFVTFFDNIREAALFCKAWIKTNSNSIFYCLTAIVIFLILYLLLLLILKEIVVPLSKRKTPNVSKLIAVIASPVSLLFLWGGLSSSKYFIKLPENLDSAVNRILYAFFALVMLNLVLRATRCVCSIVTEKLKAKNPEAYAMNKLLMDLTNSLIKLIAWCCTIFFILQNVFSLNVTHLLVSAGVLGLGIAFAAQNTIANLFGAFSILASKLFKVGDWIKTGNSEGIVERIGFRSVRIRAFTGRLIDIPNRLIADSTLENFSSHLYWREYFCYGLVYQSTPEHIMMALKIISEIGRDLSDLMLPEKPVKFNFTLCNESSLDIDGYVWFKPTDWFTMRTARDQFNREVFRRFNEAGLILAYPTTTVLLEKSNGPAEAELPEPAASAHGEIK